ncbi:hypothetical protein JG687_00012267 [Phytophthora cactorum]|uniref:Uncharacterized protein n=1 Tax=Phytophthora cactorum TaxID=29920 RepID=A0A8T1U2D1_9STRA|nr:hypothetical protein JG687_00012267 [Phytophthora cactorum]
MYNIVVTSNSNKQLKLRRRSYATLAAKVDGLPKLKEAMETTTTATSTLQFVKFAIQEPTNDALTGYEQAFLIDLIRVLRGLNGLGQQQQHFVKVYDFASCVCGGVTQKSTSNLLARWETLKRASNRGASMKIKLKVPTDMQVTMREHSTEETLGSEAIETCGNRGAHGLNAAILLNQSGGGAITVQGPTTNLTLSSITAVGPHALSTSDALLAQSPGNMILIHPSTSSSQQHGNPDPFNQSSTNTQSAPGNQSSQLFQRDSGSQRISSPRIPTFITPEHIDRLCKLEGELPNRSGKWIRIYIENIRTSIQILTHRSH